MSNLFLEKENKTPLVHCITNYVTVNDVANAVLAFGGSPIMADDLKEVEDITSICNTLVINIGTLNERTVESMCKAGKKANELGHPVVLDPVGAGASEFRTQTATKLLKEVNFTVIRGNASEIKVLYDHSGTTRGVDVSTEDQIREDNLNQMLVMAKELSEKTKAMVVITGPMDIIADTQRAYIVENGHPQMGQITGTGCMLSALLGVTLGLAMEDKLKLVTETVALMGLAGELANEYVQKEGAGTSTLRTKLIDNLQLIDQNVFEKRKKITVYENQRF